MKKTFREQIHHMLTSGESAAGQLINSFLVLLISICVVSAMFEAMRWLTRTQYELYQSLYSFAVIVFSIEYALRVWSIVDSEDKRYRPKILGRLRYMTTRSLAFIDLVVIAPWYLNLFGVVDLEFVEALNLLWVFKMMRYRPKLLDYFLIIIISLNVLTVILESVDGINKIYGEWFQILETGAVIVFTLEYFLRLWRSVSKGGDFAHPILGRIRYIFSPIAIVDLIAILPFYVHAYFFPIDPQIMLVLRLLRFMKLVRYSTAMALLLTVLRQEIKSFGAALFLLVFVATFSSGVIYLVESPVQPENFGSIPDAMYWTIITLTTVGYGDVTPVTAVGKFFSICIAITAIGMMALPAGILASAISDQIRRSRKEYESKVEKVLRDGLITEEDQAELDATRESLGLKHDDASQILEHAVHTGRAFSTCPHCGKPLNTPSRRKSRTTARVAHR